MFVNQRPCDAILGHVLGRITVLFQDVEGVVLEECKGKKGLSAVYEGVEVNFTCFEGLFQG